MEEYKSKGGSYNWLEMNLSSHPRAGRGLWWIIRQGGDEGISDECEL